MSASQIEIPSSPSSAATPWDQDPPRGNLSMLTLLAIASICTVLLTSALSPLHFVFYLGKALRASDANALGKMLNLSALSYCLDVPSGGITTEEIIFIYSEPALSREKLAPWRMNWGLFPDVSIRSFWYISPMQAEVQMSDGSTLSLERTGIWSWRLFCANFPQ